MLGEISNGIHRRLELRRRNSSSKKPSERIPGEIAK